MTTTANFATAREVATALSSLGFKPSSETIQTISRTCRDQFLDHLSKCITGQDAEGQSKKAISNLLRSLSPDALNRLKQITPNVTPEMIVPVALKAPTKLLSAIDAASNPKHERHTDAKTFLATIFPLQSNDETPPAEPAPEESPPAKRVDAAAPDDRPIGDSAPLARSRQTQAAQRPATDKKYHSCHVYGSGFALCFNATEWEDKPGVMVDAAVSIGPKAYDWKNAIHVWLDVNEVGAVLAVFRRWRKGIEFGAHGSQNDKSFSIEFQGQHFYAKVSAKKAGNQPTRAVKIMPTDATAVSILFLTQLAESYPAIPLNELLATVRATHQISDAATA
ncbi:MAG: hypothetical protein F9K30_18415 [Dechloromonas sp.]|nr:MAG: hypothetical protein F9K30_18415 [Dechloromonas sp.]